jgi:hypothetical protein
MISTPLAWCCEIFSPTILRLSPSSLPLHSVVPGYGIDLFEDDYLFLPAADLRMDPALRPRPISSLTSVTLHNSRHIYSPSAFHCDIRSTAQIGMCFDSTYTAEYLTTHRDFFLSARGTVFFFYGLGLSGEV